MFFPPQSFTSLLVPIFALSLSLSHTPRFHTIITTVHKDRSIPSFVFKLILLCSSPVRSLFHLPLAYIWCTSQSLNGARDRNSKLIAFGNRLAAALRQGPARPRRRTKTSMNDHHHRQQQQQQRSGGSTRTSRRSKTCPRRRSTVSGLSSLS